MGGALGEGDGDVATPAWDLERGGDVLIAMGGALGEGDEDVATPFPVGLWQVAGDCVSDFRGHFLVSIRARNGWRP
jgi:hypothetical protein